MTGRSRSPSPAYVGLSARQIHSVADFSVEKRPDKMQNIPVYARCRFPRQRFAMVVDAEKGRLKRVKVMDESFYGINVSEKAAATLCPECDPVVQGHEIFWESHAESKRLAQAKLKQWESPQTEEP